MPAQVLPTIVGMSEFTEKINQAGFTKIGGDEFRQVFHRYGLIAPRPREGRELGFRYHWNGLTVFVWTTWLEREMRARDFDSGWVLIIQEGKRAYVRRFNRTENFLLKMYRYAVIARKRVIKRPICLEHKVYMRIVFGKGIKSRYWKCDYGEHKNLKFARESFDHGLSREMLEFLESERKIRARWRKKIRAQGKEPGAAIRKRKPWGMTNPPIEQFK